MSRIISKWLTIMDDELRYLIIWPTRVSQWKTMPLCFHSSFAKDVAVILECFEVLIERPTNLLARACTLSSYKHHNSVNILLGITPQGTVSYVCEACGGRVSDKYESCGILNHLLPGGIVLADRGFDISDSVGMMQARLHIHCTMAFTHGNSQLGRGKDTLYCYCPHSCRTSKNKSILKGIFPLEYVAKKPDGDSPYIDKIVCMCCALCNVVVPFD